MKFLKLCAKSKPFYDLHLNIHQKLDYKDFTQLFGAFYSHKTRSNLKFVLQTVTNAHKI